MADGDKCDKFQWKWIAQISIFTVGWAQHHGGEKMDMVLIVLQIWLLLDRDLHLWEDDHKCKELFSLCILIQGMGLLDSVSFNESSHFLHSTLLPWLGAIKICTGCGRNGAREGCWHAFPCCYCLSFLFFFLVVLKFELEASCLLVSAILLEPLHQPWPWPAFLWCEKIQGKKRTGTFREPFLRKSNSL
jgi:hypothetical protein